MHKVCEPACRHVHTPTPHPHIERSHMCCTYMYKHCIPVGVCACESYGEKMYVQRMNPMETRCMNSRAIEWTKPIGTRFCKKGLIQYGQGSVQRG